MSHNSLPSAVLPPCLESEKHAHDVSIRIGFGRSKPETLWGEEKQAQPPSNRKDGASILLAVSADTLPHSVHRSGVTPGA